MAPSCSPPSRRPLLLPRPFTLAADGILLVGLAVITPGCVDDAASPGTTPRRSASPPASSDAPDEPRGSAGSPGAAPGVPSGLDMRGGAAGRAVTVPARSTYKDPRNLAAPWIGGAKAAVVIEEFTDFECPFCRRGWQTMKRIVERYGSRVKLVFHHLPLRYHKQARLAAQAAVCAQAQGRFWAMQDMLFRNNRALSRADIIGYARRLGLDVARFRRDLDGGACLDRVKADVALARKRGIEGTPAFFINGEKHEGALPFKTFRQLIDAALDE